MAQNPFAVFDDDDDSTKKQPANNQAQQQQGQDKQPANKQVQPNVNKLPDKQPPKKAGNQDAEVPIKKTGKKPASEKPAQKEPVPEAIPVPIPEDEPDELKEEIDALTTDVSTREKNFTTEESQRLYFMVKDLLGLTAKIYGVTVEQKKEIRELKERLDKLEKRSKRPMTLSEPLNLDSIFEKNQLKASLRRLSFKGAHSMEVQVNDATIVFPHVNTVPNPSSNGESYAALFDKQQTRHYTESSLGLLRKDTMTGTGECRVRVRDSTGSVVREESFGYSLSAIEGQTGYRTGANGVVLYVDDIGSNSFRMRVIAVNKA